MSGIDLACEGTSGSLLSRHTSRKSWSLRTEGSTPLLFGGYLARNPGTDCVLLRAVLDCDMDSLCAVRY
eukprot:1749403-Rhodomonas_salina.4